MAGERKYIGDLVRQVEELGSKRSIATMAREISTEVLKQIDAGFAGRRDPYGRAWAKTQRPNPILEDTGTMRGGWSATVTEGEIVAQNATAYAAYHQAGTSRLPPRMMVPTRARGLGGIWGPALVRAAERAFRKLVKQ